MGGVAADDLSRHLQNGIRLHQAGQVQEAARAYQKILESNPDHADANHLLGVLVGQNGNPTRAVAMISKAIKADRNQPIYHNNLGNMLKNAGRLDDAAASYREALSLKPDYAGAHYNLGSVLRELGRLDDAVASYRKALVLEPDSAEVHGNLGMAFQDLGRPGDAFTCYRRASALKPSNDSYRTAMAECLKDLTFSTADDETFQELLSILDRPTVNPLPLARPIVSALRHHPEIARLLEFTRSGEPEAQIVYADAAERLAGLPLLLRIMELSPVNVLEIEWLFTTLRRAMIQETMAGKRAETDLPFSAALALYCFTNEYVFSETAQETAAVEHIQQEIAALVDSGQNPSPALVTALGAYRPLHQFPWAGKLLQCPWTGDIKRVTARQIGEPMEEQSLRSDIPCRTPIQDVVSQAVRKQYEENPYPRWTRTGRAAKPETIGAFVRRSPLRFELEDYDPPESPEILIAGCGTGRHVLHTASRFENSRILAMDLSVNSLAYALRKTRQAGLSNVDFVQGDIMELGCLEQQFDLIECVGVLHHLQDPPAGWRVLVDLLRTGGLMKIGLYSEAARQDVVSARALIAEEGYRATADGIRRCRQHVVAKAKAGDPDMAKICARPSFFTLSECRDLLFHVHEHRFTLPEIEAAIKALELRFLGFDLADRNALRTFRKSYPDRNAETSLPHWHQFELENPDTFRGMYQFWCHKGPPE